MTYEGRCACGAVRYSLAGAPKFSYFCQCGQCQRASGTGHAAHFMVDADSLTVTGELRGFEQFGDSGNTVTRKFCPACGTYVVLGSSGYPDVRFIPAGTLDDPSRFVPTQVLWHSAAQTWDSVDPDLKINAAGV